MTGKPPRKADTGEAASPHFHGHRDRLRARFLETGDQGLPDYELLELLLYRTIPRRDVKPIAKALVSGLGSFAETLGARIERLMEFPGVGESTAIDIKIVEAAGRRLAKGAVRERPVLGSWKDVIEYCRAAMAFADRIAHLGDGAKLARAQRAHRLELLHLALEQGRLHQLTLWHLYLFLMLVVNSRSG